MEALKRGNLNAVIGKNPKLPEVAKKYVENLENELNNPLELPWNEIIVPEYGVGKIGNWEIEGQILPQLLRGYFRGLQILDKKQMRSFKLKHNGDVWMSTTPMEVESMQHILHYAHGHVVLAGIGMGLRIFNLLKNPNVKSLTVVDIDKDVIALFYAIYKFWAETRQLTTDEMKKLNPFIVHEDIKKVDWIRYKVDFLTVDIWMELGAEEALEDMKQIQKNIKAKQVAWWGMEYSFMDFIMERGSSPTAVKTMPHLYDKWIEKAGMPILKVEDHHKWAYKAVENAWLT